MKPGSRLWRFTMWVADRPAEFTILVLVILLIPPTTFFLWKMFLHTVLSC